MFPLLVFCFISPCHSYLTSVESDENCIETTHVPSIIGQNVSITCNMSNTLDCCIRGLWRGKGEKWLLPDNCEDCGESFSVTENLSNDINILQISNISKSDAGIYICQCDVNQDKDGCRRSDGRLNFRCFNVTIPDCQLQYEVNGARTNLYGSFGTRSKEVVDVRVGDYISIRCTRGSIKTDCSQLKNEPLITVVKLSHQGCKFRCRCSKDTMISNIVISLNVTSINTSPSIMTSVTPATTDDILTTTKTFDWTSRMPKTNISSALTRTVEASSLGSTNGQYGLSSAPSHLLIDSTSEPILNTVKGSSLSNELTTAVSTTINDVHVFPSAPYGVSINSRSNDEFYHQITSVGLRTTSKPSDFSTITAAGTQVVNISTHSLFPANDFQVIILSAIIVASGVILILFCVGVFLFRTGRQCFQAHKDKTEEWINPIYDSTENGIQLKAAPNQYEVGNKKIPAQQHQSV